MVDQEHSSIMVGIEYCVMWVWAHSGGWLCANVLFLALDMKIKVNDTTTTTINDDDRIVVGKGVEEKG